MNEQTKRRRDLAASLIADFGPDRLAAMTDETRRSQLGVFRLQLEQETGCTRQNAHNHVAAAYKAASTGEPRPAWGRPRRQTMEAKYTRTITRKDGTQLAEFSGPNGNVCVKLLPGMTIEDARGQAIDKMALWSERVTEMLGF